MPRRKRHENAAGYRPRLVTQQVAIVGFCLAAAGQASAQADAACPEPAALSPQAYLRYSTLWLNPTRAVDGIGSALLLNIEAGWWGPFFELGIFIDVGSVGSCGFCEPWGHDAVITRGAAGAVRFWDSAGWGAAVRTTYRNFSGQNNLIDTVGGALSVWRQAGGPKLHREGFRINIRLDLIFEEWIDAGRATPAVGAALGLQGALRVDEVDTKATK
jgi:hypothetical protein